MHISRFKPWFVFLGAFLLIGTIVAHRVTSGESDDGSNGNAPHDDSQLIRILRAGRGLIAEDRQLVSDMSGDQIIGEAEFGGAVCVASLDWLRDFVLSPTMIVSTDPALVRAAELYEEAIAADDLATASMIARAEQAYWRRDADLDSLRDWADSLADDDDRESVRQYLDQREQPPSEEASRRFVVYVVQGNTVEQRMFYLDTYRVDPDLLGEPASRRLPSEVLVAGEDEFRSMNLADCDELADDWDRYDPSLPGLPPLQERWQLDLDGAV